VPENNVFSFSRLIKDGFRLFLHNPECGAKGSFMRDFVLFSGLLQALHPKVGMR